MYPNFKYFFSRSCNLWESLIYKKKLGNWPKVSYIIKSKAKIMSLTFSLSAINLPHCRTPESYRHTEKIAEKLFFYGQWNPNQCTCRQQCMKMLFTSSLESTTDRFKITKGRTKARVRLYYQVNKGKYITGRLGYF